MKRIYTALCALMFLFLMFMGLFSTFDKDATFSESEKRQLKTRPKLTISGLLDGNYWNEYRAYFADTFPGREGLMDKNTTLNTFYYFSGLSGKDDAQLVIGFDSNAWDVKEGTEDDLLPVLIRKGEWDTDVTLMAEVNYKEDGEEEDDWQEVLRYNFYFGGLDLELRPHVRFGELGRDGRIFT